MKFLLPFSCVLCHGQALTKDLCEACSLDLPWIKNACQRCGLPLTSDLQIDCGECQKNPPYYDATVVLFHYAEPISTLINRFKFHQQLVYGNLFANLLSEKLALPWQSMIPELLVPVPLHPARLRQRGYNQALELARPVAKVFKLKIDYRHLIRNRNTEQQALIAENKRNANIQGAFTMIKPLSVKHVALFDDVMTTAYTVNECSKILKNSGVEKITVVAIARTNLK